ncbi:hypothetical protein [Methanolobus profundi]|nr:hypothetical protein [Methanolobus profundi]
MATSFRLIAKKEHRIDYGIRGSRLNENCHSITTKDVPGEITK